MELINNTRIFFGPARSRTTSIWKYLKDDPNYFTTINKEFGGVFYVDTKITDEIYFKGYNEDQIYVDCSLAYYHHMTKCNLTKKFKEDIFVYNIRPFNEFIRSYFTITSLFNVSNFPKTLNHILPILDIRKMYISLKLQKKYMGKLCFIPSENFNLNDIFEYYNLPKTKEDNTIHNSTGELLKWFPIKQESKSGIPIDEFIKLHEQDLEKFERYMKNNRNKIQQIAKQNLDFFKTVEDLFVFGKINEEQYMEKL